MKFLVQRIQAVLDDWRANNLSYASALQRLGELGVNTETAARWLER